MTPATVGITASVSPRRVVPRSAHPDVSLVTVTYGTDAAIIDEHLERMISSLHAAAVDAEIIVVDNPHPDRAHHTAEHVALSTSGVVLVCPDSNLGFGGGNEFGLLYAQADIICLVNPDLMVHDGWLGPMLAALRRNPQGIVAPRFIRRDGSLLDAGHRVDADGQTHPVGLGDTPDYVSAACWMFHRSWHERTGGFDPRFHPAYYEDVDLSFRSQRLGGTTVMAATDVIHDHGASTPDGPRDVSEQHATFQALWRDDLRYFGTPRTGSVSPIALTSSSNRSNTPIA